MMLLISLKTAKSFLTRKRERKHWAYLKTLKRHIDERFKKLKENVESVSDFEIEDLKNSANETLSIMNKDQWYETPDFNKETIFDILNKVNNFQKGKGLTATTESNEVEYIFLPSDPNELCDRLKILLQEKTGGNNNPQIDQEIMAISDKFLEYKIIEIEEHENMINKLLN